MEKDFFLQEIISKKKECKNVVEEISSLNSLLQEDIKELNELIEETEIDTDILNIPKFKGQIIFEKYLLKIEQKNNKNIKVKDKKKIRGLIEKNEVIKMQKDINRLKEIIK